MRKKRKRIGKLGLLAVFASLIIVIGGCSAGIMMGLAERASSEGKGAPTEEVLSGGDSLNEGLPGTKEPDGETAGYEPGKDHAGIQPGSHDGQSLPGKGDNQGKPDHGGTTGEAGGEPSNGGTTGEDGGEPSNGGTTGEAGGKPSNGGTTGEAGGEPSNGGTTGEAGGKPSNGGTTGEAGGKPDDTVKKIAITFDDGPDTRYTTAILDILKEKNVKATFFVVGMQVEKYPDVLKRIVEEGHAIGNHTQGHKDLSKLSQSQIEKEISEADKAIEKVLGYAPSMFRAPYGALSPTLKKTLAEHDRSLVGWTVDTRDWAGTSIADMRKVIRNDSKPNGIILMHSFGGKHIANTVEMLPDVIDDLRELGYTFVTTDELSE